MRRHLLEDLLHVDFDDVGDQTGIAEHNPQRLKPGQLLDQVLILDPYPKIMGRVEKSKRIF